MVKKERRSLAKIAQERDMSEEALIMWALKEGGNPYAAAMLIGISTSSIRHAMKKHGLEVEQPTVVVRKVQKDA